MKKKKKKRKKLTINQKPEPVSWLPYPKEWPNYGTIDNPKFF